MQHVKSRLQLSVCFFVDSLEFFHLSVLICVTIFICKRKIKLVLKMCLKLSKTDVLSCTISELD